LQNIQCPVLAFYGDLDKPLMEKLPQVRDEMHEAGIDFEAVVYPNALHAFFNDTNARTYNADFAADAWAKSKAFVAANVG
jgi:carboxymethylenebutenolidase